MAKKSMIAREVKRQKLVEKNLAKREALKAIILSHTASDDDKIVAETKRCQGIPRLRAFGIGAD